MPRKLFVVLITIAVTLGLSVAPSFSGRYTQKRNNFQKHMKHSHKAALRTYHQSVLHMYLMNGDGQWTLTRNAPRGKMKYNMWGETFNFTFKGIKLSPNTAYTLLYYNESGVSDIIQLGEGVTDRRGRVYFENSVDTCSMPAGDDDLTEYGARILLVPSATFYEDAGFIFPDSDTYLEGSHLIRFFDTDGCQTTEPDDDWVDEEPDNEYPVIEEPTGEYPVVEEPVGEHPVVEEPAGEYPNVEEPTGEYPEPPADDPDQVDIPF